MIQPFHDSSPARILVVDDEPNIRAPLVRALELSGYIAESAESGQRALEMLKATAYDLMILDLRMPGVDGVEVMRAARQIAPDLILLILTGHATLQSAIAAVKAGATDYLIKPLSAHQIIAAIQNALQKRSQQTRRQHLIQTALAALRAVEMIETTALPPNIPPHPTSPPRERFHQRGLLTLDRARRIVIVNRTPPHSASLTEGEARVLECLLDAANQPLACQQIAQQVWQYTLSWKPKRSSAPTFSASAKKSRLILKTRS